MSPTSVACRESTTLVDRLPQALVYCANLEHGDHAVLFYDNLAIAAEYFCAYVEEGIYREETTCFICPSRKLYQTLFEQAGISVTSLENCGYLTHLSLEDMYSRDVEPGKNRMVHSFQNYLREAMSSVAGGIRFIHLVQQIPEYIPAKDVLEFEQSIGALSPYPMSILCCYDARVVLEERPQLFPELVKAHGHCIFQGAAMPTSTLLEVNSPQVRNPLLASTATKIHPLDK
jgi:hypothetical protein